MDSKIEISILIPSRRPKLLKEYMLLNSSMAKYPERIEWIVRIDDDDKESITMLKTDNELKNNIQNLKVFIGPRVGFVGMSQTFYWLGDQAKGDILIPFGDDLKSVKQDWDEVIYALVYLNKTPIVIGDYHFVVICSKDIFKDIWTDNCDMADLLIVEEAEKRGILIKSPYLFEIRRDIASVLRCGWRPESQVLLDLYEQKLNMKNMDDFTLEELMGKRSTLVERLKQLRK